MQKIFAIAFLLFVPVRYAIAVWRKRLPKPSIPVATFMIVLVTCAILLLLIFQIGEFGR